MNKIGAIIVTIILGLQLVSAQVPGYYLAYLTDKDGLTITVSEAAKYLSPIALEKKYKRGIKLDEKDIPVSIKYLQAIENTGAEIIKTSKWLNVVEVKIDDVRTYNEIASLSFVKQLSWFYNPDYHNTRSNNDKWQLKENTQDTAKTVVNELDYGYSFNQIRMLKLDDLHVYGFQGQDMTIGIFDAGFANADNMYCFQEVFDEGRVLDTYNIVGNNDTVFSYHSHGTSVWSSIAGYINNDSIRYKGTAPKANFYLFRTEYAPTETPQELMNWVIAAELADSLGVDIINSSLGYSTFDDENDDFSYADMNGDSTLITIAADIAAAKGILVVSSAGNSGNDAWQYITAPADADSILTVGAVDSVGIYANFSSKGPTYDGRIKPDVVAQGKEALLCRSDNGVYASNGTSFSSPIIAGAVACLWGAFPHKTNMEIIQAVKASSSIYTSPDTLRGYGIPNFSLAYQLLGGECLERFDENLTIQNNQNLFSDSYSLHYFTQATKNFQVVVSDLQGKILYYEEVNDSAYSYYTLPESVTQNMIPGLYIVRIKSASMDKQIKILKM